MNNKRQSRIEKWQEQTNLRGQILECKPGFQEEIKSLREKYDISVGGFQISEEVVAWNKKFKRVNRDYYETNRPSNRKEYDELVKNGLFERATRLEKEFNANQPLNYLNLKIHQMVAKYKMSPGWFEGIRSYLLTNTFVMSLGPTITESINLEYDCSEITINLQGKMTRADYEAISERLAAIQDNLPYVKKEKERLLTNFPLYKRTHELIEDRKPSSTADTLEIAVILEREFDKEGKINLTDIKKYEQRYFEALDNY